MYQSRKPFSGNSEARFCTFLFFLRLIPVSTYLLANEWFAPSGLDVVFSEQYTRLWYLQSFPLELVTDDPNGSFRSLLQNSHIVSG